MSITISLTNDELLTIITALDMNEFQNYEDHSDETKKYLHRLCLKLIKKYQSTGYTTEQINMLKKFLTEDYLNSKHISQLD